MATPNSTMSPETRKRLASIAKIYGTNPDDPAATMAAVWDDLGAHAKAADAAGPLTPERVAELARFHGLSEREIVMCAEVGAPIATYRQLKAQQRSARAASGVRR